MNVRGWGLLFLVLSFGALSIPSHGWAQERSASDAPRGPEPVRGLDVYVQRAMESWQAPGLSLVIVRGDSVSTRAYGVTEVDGRTPVTPETLFGIGSLTKAFTATLLAMLVDAGALAWDDPVVRHLPGFAMHDPYVTEHLTIRDVLSHRTGLGRSDLMWVPGGVDPDELLHRLRFQEPSFGFRAGYGYNNVMYLLAGRIAEEVTGERWEDLVDRRIFEPLGMRRSTTTIGELRGRSDVALPHDEIGPGQLLGTAPRPDVPLNAPMSVRRVDWLDPVTSPAGGIASSAAEFGRWLRFQLARGEVGGRRLIGEEALLETRTPQMVVPGFPRSQSEPAEMNLGAYGMGWGLRDYRGHLMLSHLGSAPGWSGAVALLPTDDAAVAVFVNFTRGQWLANAVMRWTVDRLLGAEVEDWSEAALDWTEARQRANVAALEEAAAERSTETRPSLPQGAYVGTYVDSLHPPARVTASGGRLRLILGPNLSGDLDHWESDTFRVIWDRPDFGANLVTFGIGDGGRPETLRTRILGQAAEWSRSGGSSSESSRRDPDPVRSDEDGPR